MNKRFNLILMLVLLCCNHLVTAQDKASQTVSQLKQYVAERPQEKLFIHLDKPFYAQTDDIWFKVYLVEATNHLPRKDALVYVELVDVVGNVVATRNIQVLDGGGFGLEEARHAIEIVYKIRHAETTTPGPQAHPLMLKKDVLENAS